jgi:hypothetical protein
MTDPSRKVLWYILACTCFLFYIFVISGSINKPFTTDEIYYAGWASGIAKNGTPAYYPGEGISLRPKLIEPLSHPPLHFILLAGMVSIFGLKYWALRLLGVILFAATLLFLRFKIYKKDAQPNEQVFLTGMFLVFNPLFMQQSMVLAIEAQAFWFFLLIFLYAFYRESIDTSRPKYFPYIFSSVAMLVLLWLKETNIPVYIFVCVSFLFLIKLPKRVPLFLASLMLAAAFFWVTWLVYCSFSDVDVYSWWNFTVKNKMMKGSLGINHVIAEKGFAVAFWRVIASLKVSISWISAPYFILFIIAIFIRIRELIVEKRAIGFIEFCLLYALVLFAVTKVLRPTTDFIKYETPAHLLMAIFLSDVFLSRLRKDTAGFLIAVGAGILIGVGMYPLFQDRILRLSHQFPTHAALGIGIILVTGAFYSYVRKVSVIQSAIVGSVAGFIALNTHLSMHQAFNVYTTGQSWGNYGEDLTTPTEWLKEHLKNGERFAAFKDLQFNLRFVEGMTRSKTYEARLFTKWVSVKQKQKKKILASGKIKYIVLNRYSKTPGADKFLKQNNYRKIKKTKNHVIYKRIKCPSCVTTKTNL